MKNNKFFKALLVTGVSVIAASTACFGVAACTPAEEHQHTYSAEWNNDGTNHWHDATCEHTNEKSELGAHDTNGTNGACSVCGYKDETPAPAHQHTYSPWVNTDADKHWQTCTGDNCTEDAGKHFNEAAHDTNGADGACSVCGYKAAPITPAHTHTYSAWVNTDATNHWQICTGTDCTEEAGKHFNEAAHNIGADGVCSVCGYQSFVTPTYSELVAKEGKIISNDFETAAEKLDTFSGTYGTAGLYSSCNSSVTTETNYIKVEGGKAVMVDPGAGETHFVVDFGLTAGVVEGYFEITLASSANSWTPVQFVNVNGTEILGLRTDGGKIKYRLGGSSGTITAGVSDIATADTTYKLYFKFDGATKKFIMTIDGKMFIKDAELQVSELGGVRFVSSNSGSRTAAVDNLVIVNDIAVADLKTAISARLQSVYETYDLTNKYTTNGADVTSAYNTGVTAITSAENKEAIVTAYNTAVAAMKAVKSDLAIYKEGKVSELQTYATAKGETNYTAENWQEMQAKVAEGISAINKASDNAAVDTALATAKTAVDAIPDNSAQEELNKRDDCPATVLVAGTPKEISFNGATAKDNLKNFDGYGFDAFLGIASDSGRVQIKSNFLDVYSGASDQAVGGILTVTTTSAKAVLAITFNGVNANRYFIIYDASGNVYGNGAAVTEGLPTGAYEQKAADANKVLTITLGDAGVYTLKFAGKGNTKAVEHKIDKISLTESVEQEVTAKVNAVTATVTETATAGVAVADIVSKISVQLDYNGEMINGEITEKDQFTVIVKNAAGEVVTSDTLAEGTYTVIVIFGGNREESAATQYNSHTYTVTVQSAE